AGDPGGRCSPRREALGREPTPRRSVRVCLRPVAGPAVSPRCGRTGLREHVLREVVGRQIAPTRQEVFFFGPARGDLRFDDSHCPVWIDYGERFVYGIPGNHRGVFKVAADARGPRIDPTTEDRMPTKDALARARELLVRRFPALARAPV